MCCNFEETYRHNLRGRGGGGQDKGERPRKPLTETTRRGENSIVISRRDTRTHANDSLGVALGADNGRERSNAGVSRGWASTASVITRRTTPTRFTRSKPEQRVCVTNNFGGGEPTLPLVRRVGIVDCRLALPQ